MNKLANILKVPTIALDLESTSKKRLLEQAALLFENEYGIERGKVFDSLFSRERLGTTGLGAGVAVPHGRIKGLKYPLMAVVRTKEGLGFEAPDGKPVRIFFVLLVPEASTEEHLEILSAIAELLSDKSTREALITAEDPEALLQLVNAWVPYQPSV